MVGWIRSTYDIETRSTTGLCYYIWILEIRVGKGISSRICNWHVEMSCCENSKSLYKQDLVSRSHWHQYPRTINTLCKYVMECPSPAHLEIKIVPHFAEDTNQVLSSVSVVRQLTFLQILQNWKHFECFIVTSEQVIMWHIMCSLTLFSPIWFAKCYRDLQIDVSPWGNSKSTRGIFPTT